MKYERLTLRTVHGEVQQLTTRAGILDRLAELEDKIESGQLVELPAPIGSDLWEIEMPHYKDSNGKSWTVCTYKGAKVKKLKYKLSLSNVDMVVDRHYFVSKSQAEARLKELQGE